MEITLQEAEKIVDANSNLTWDGWTIEAFNKDDNACLLTTGRFRNGSWHKVQRFSVNKNGFYDIPNRFIRSIRH